MENVGVPLERRDGRGHDGAGARESGTSPMMSLQKPMQWVATEQFQGVQRRAAVPATRCAALRSHGILEVGHTLAGQRWCFVRPAPLFALVLVTTEGCGEVLVNQEWQKTGPETAYLMPNGSLHGYRVARRHRSWHYVWARLEDMTRYPWLFPHQRPRVVPASSSTLHAATTGLLAEGERGADPELSACWCALLNASLRHLVPTPASDARLARLWTAVESRLHERWTLPRMAASIAISREHLRRLCRAGYGCSPHRQLVTLRLRQAAHLLVHTTLSLERIAVRVGFSDGFSLSRAFKRHFGAAPSVYRKAAHRPTPAHEMI
jgi:AraC-like DNA-binding protein